MNKETTKLKSRNELIDELFVELDKMTDADIVNELRLTASGSLKVAMDPMYVTNKIFKYIFSLKITHPAKKTISVDPALWSKYADADLSFACNDSSYEALVINNYLMAA